MKELTNDEFLGMLAGKTKEQLFEERAEKVSNKLYNKEYKDLSKEQRTCVITKSLCNEFNL